MTFQHYLKEPMQKAELKLNAKIDENPHLIYALDRSVNHSLIRKNYHRPFPNLS